MAELQTALQEKIDEWSVKVDRLLDQSDEQTKLGRLLVEERAKTLDLQRQIYRLEHGLNRTQQELRDLLAQAEQTVGKLARSRTFRRLSFLTTRPQRALGQAQHLLEHMRFVLDRG
jgi:hypothetical protein